MGAHPEPTVCNVFYACVDGVAEEYTCSPGLYFDEYKGVCNWPLDSERTNCKSDHEANSVNGFTCPEIKASDPLGISDPHPKYADADDCAKFYICLTESAQELKVVNSVSLQHSIKTMRLPRKCS